MTRTQLGEESRAVAAEVDPDAHRAEGSGPEEVVAGASEVAFLCEPPADSDAPEAQILADAARPGSQEVANARRRARWSSANFRSIATPDGHRNLLVYAASAERYAADLERLPSESPPAGGRVEASLQRVYRSEARLAAALRSRLDPAGRPP